MALDDDVAGFAADVGPTDQVTIAGSSTRGGGVPDVRTVTAPRGVAWIEPAEMTVCCGAATPVDDLAAALREHGQCVVLPDGGTVGGALAVGHSGLRRLSWGPARDAVLQMRYVSAGGEIVKAGGPTVKNVSGFDLCRLMVGSRGTLGFIADVILRTRPLPPCEQWFSTGEDPWTVLQRLHRPLSVLWNGSTTWALLAGHADDVASEAERSALEPTGGPPALPPYRWSVAPSALAAVADEAAARADAFVAEVGVGIVHHARPAEIVPPDPVLVEVHRRIKERFDPSGRLNPGVDVLAP